MDRGDVAALVVLWLVIIAIVVVTIVKGTSWLWEVLGGVADAIRRGG